MRHFYIVSNTLKDPHQSVTNSVVDYLEQKGCTCTIRGESHRQSCGPYRYTDPDHIPEEVDCIIVLGGDGTLILTATDTIERQIPLLGINLGTLGYLAEVDVNSIYTALDRVTYGAYQIESRMLLEGNVYHSGKLISKDIALNDIVIRKDDKAGMIRVKNYVNNAYLNQYHADGMIISTPTGSTGYSLSVGGPIISPKAELFEMTPIAVHDLNTRSILLPADEMISVAISEGRDGTVEKAAAYFDGETKVPMGTGDRIDIIKSKQYAHFVKLYNDSFLEILRRKMNRG